MESFYITLPSNVRNNHFDNTVANFRTELAQELKLSDDWLVGLAGISYTNSWYNIIEEQKITVIYYDDNSFPSLPKTQQFDLPRGKYKKIDDLLVAMDFQWKRFYTKHLPNVDVSKSKKDRTPKPIFNYRATDNRVTITLPKLNHKDVYFSFSQELCQILGFEKQDLDSLSGDAMISYAKNINNNSISNINSDNEEKFLTLTGIRPYSLEHIYYGLYVYCDIIKPSFVGDTLTHLLRFVEIPPNINYGDQIVISYPDTHYIPLLIKNFKNIEIHIKDEYGNSFPFEFGRSIIILHFMKNNKSQ